MNKVLSKEFLYVDVDEIESDKESESMSNAKIKVKYYDDTDNLIFEHVIFKSELFENPRNFLNLKSLKIKSRKIPANVFRLNLDVLEILDMFILEIDDLDEHENIKIKLLKFDGRVAYTGQFDVFSYKLYVKIPKIESKRSFALTCKKCDKFVGHMDNLCNECYCIVNKIPINIKKKPHIMTKEEIDLMVNFGLHSKNTGKCKICLTSDSILYSKFACICESHVCLSCLNEINVCPTCKANKYGKINDAEVEKILLSNCNDVVVKKILLDWIKRNNVHDGIVTLRNCITTANNITKIVKNNWEKIDTSSDIFIEIYSLAVDPLNAPKYINNKYIGFVHCYKGFSKQSYYKSFNDRFGMSKVLSTYEFSI